MERKNGLRRGYFGIAEYQDGEYYALQVGVNEKEYNTVVLSRDVLISVAIQILEVCNYDIKEQEKIKKVWE